MTRTHGACRKKRRRYGMSNEGRKWSAGGMVDIRDKEVVARTAVASGKIILSAKTVEAIRRGAVKKGDVYEVARAAAFLAVKNTPGVIPHCHPIPVEKVAVEFASEIAGEKGFVSVRCEVSTTAKTGVEMEALHGVLVALLTIWDMVKYMEKDEKGQYPHTRITDVVVEKKVKGDG